MDNQPLSREQAIRFLWQCLKELGGAFHPDDDFGDYMRTNPQSGVMTYTSEEAMLRNQQMKQVRLVLPEEEMYDILFYFEQQPIEEPSTYQPDEFTRRLLAEDIAREAEEAFWAVVAKRYATIKTGDFADNLNPMLTAAVLLWEQSNTVSPD
jgi:hypothetical protein